MSSLPATLGRCSDNAVEVKLFDGKTLAGWKPSAFDQHGTAEAENGQLIIRAGKPMSGLTWKGEFPTTNYEVTLEAKRISGGDFFCGLTFPVGEDFCSLIVGGWGGGLVGLSSIDGRDAAENETTIYDQFEDDRWYNLRLLVTDERIKAWIDRKRYVHVVRRNHEFSVRHEVESSRPFGIATYQTTAAFRKVQLRRIKPAPWHPGSIYAELNVAYADADASSQQLDMLLPSYPNKSPLPIVVFIADGHDSGARRRGLAWLEPLVASGQYAGAAVGYRLISADNWAAPIQDCQAAIRWLGAHAEQFDVDAQRIGVMGLATGGQLAALLGTHGGVHQATGDSTDQSRGRIPVRCVVSLAGRTDLTHLQVVRSNRDASIESIVSKRRSLSGDGMGLLSPLSYVTPDDPPFLLAHGTRDAVVPYAQSRLLSERLRAVGVSSTLITVDGGNHEDLRPEHLDRSIEAFFEKHLHGKRRILKDQVIRVESRAGGN